MVHVEPNQRLDLVQVLPFRVRLSTEPRKELTELIAAPTVAAQSGHMKDMEMQGVCTSTGHDCTLTDAQPEMAACLASEADGMEAVRQETEATESHDHAPEPSERQPAAQQQVGDVDCDAAALTLDN